jgi:hypothetical protein
MILGGEATLLTKMGYPIVGVIGKFTCWVTVKLKILPVPCHLKRTLTLNK